MYKLFLSRYLGRSIEKVVFIFKNMTYNVGIIIDVTENRLINSPNNPGVYTPRNIDLK